MAFAALARCMIPRELTPSSTSSMSRVCASEGDHVAADLFGHLGCVELDASLSRPTTPSSGRTSPSMSGATPLCGRSSISNSLSASAYSSWILKRKRSSCDSGSSKTSRCSYGFCVAMTRNGIGQAMALALDRDLALLHRFEQRGLRAWGRAVDLVCEEDVREDDALDENVLAGADRVGARELGRSRVGRELDALELRAEHVRGGATEQRLRAARAALRAARARVRARRRAAARPPLLPDDDLRDLGLRPLAQLDEALERRLDEQCHDRSLPRLQFSVAAQAYPRLREATARLPAQVPHRTIGGVGGRQPPLAQIGIQSVDSESHESLKPAAAAGCHQAVETGEMGRGAGGTGVCAVAIAREGRCRRSYRR